MSAAEMAILQLAQARAAVEALSCRIGDALKSCNDQQVNDAQDCNTILVHHLENAYAILRDDDGDAYFEHHDGDAGAYLSTVCPHCRAAHDAIQERKLAKKQYGIAKRRISLMGSTMIKNKSKATS